MIHFKGLTPKVEHLSKKPVLNRSDELCRQIGQFFA